MPEKINPLADIDINENLYNLYTILLQYLDRLIKLNHPKINLVTEVLDLLIVLRENKEISNSKEELKIRFNEIHSIAYNNLSIIYDYDKEIEEEKKKMEEKEKINLEVI
jgi:hypothetical protein